MQQEWWLWLATLDRQLKPGQWLKQGGKEGISWLSAVCSIPKHMRETQAHVRMEEHKLDVMRQLVEQPVASQQTAGQKLDHWR
jgi:hypothetical protein